VTTATTRRVLARGAEIERIVARLAHQILEPNEAARGLVLLGVRRGGEALATRLAAQIERISGSAPAVGFLNINLYRDDRVSHALPESQIPLDLSDRIVVIVDDVLFTGRTIRSALDAIIDLGRPAAIRLCVLIDRGLRELPIQPDYVGRFAPTSAHEHVYVTLAPQAASSDEIAITGGESHSRADTA
jgi:pyrimidine operon attenuation protein / uracil phosphoribosyltransferase